MEDTLVIIKPDAVQRGLVGQVLSRFEAVGFEIVQMCMHGPDRDLMCHFYAEHEAKPHFARLIDYMVAGPSCFVRLRREGGIERARIVVGATDPAEASPGTIRGDLGLDLPRNSVHASDCRDAAAREIELIFPSRPSGTTGAPQSA